MLITVYDSLMRISIENNENYKIYIYIQWTTIGYITAIQMWRSNMQLLTIVKWFNISLGNVIHFCMKCDLDMLM